MIPNAQLARLRATRMLLGFGLAAAAILVCSCGAQEQPTAPETAQGDEGPELKAQPDRSATEAEAGAAARGTEDALRGVFRRSERKDR